MTIRIGANPIGWSNDDMQEIRRLDSARAMPERGEGSRLRRHGARQQVPARVSEAAPDPRPLWPRVCIGGWHSIFLIERDAETEFTEAAAHRKLLKEMGTDVFIVAECTRTVHGDKSKPLSQRPIMTEAEWKTFHRAPDAACRTAARVTGSGSSIIITWERWCRRRTEIDRLMENTGEAVHLLLDTGHATWGGADPAVLARKYPIAHRRMCIARMCARTCARKPRRRTGRSSMRCIAGVYTVPGDGMVDYCRCSRNCRLFRLGRRRGRAGSEEGRARQICQDGL